MNILGLTDNQTRKSPFLSNFGTIEKEVPSWFIFGKPKKVKETLFNNKPVNLFIENLLVNLNKSKVDAIYIMLDTRNLDKNSDNSEYIYNFLDNLIEIFPSIPIMFVIEKFDWTINNYEKRIDHYTKVSHRRSFLMEYMVTEPRVVYADKESKSWFYNQLNT